MMNFVLTGDNAELVKRVLEQLDKDDQNQALILLCQQYEEKITSSNIEPLPFEQAQIR